MTSEKNNEHSFSIPLKSDEMGYFGRECPNADCKKYFKVRFGTGLDTTEIYCPYCGYQGQQNEFFTEEQLRYVKSHVTRFAHKLIQDTLIDSIKQIQRTGQKSQFISFEFRPGALLPIEHYSEKNLETYIKCQNCTLEYAVYGVFAFCPDCCQRNSLQMFNENIMLVNKSLELIGEIDIDIKNLFLESCLKKCVDLFDAFGKELCRVHISMAKDPKQVSKISFQNIEVAKQLFERQFGIDFSVSISDDEWNFLKICFQKRNCYTHSMGVIDEDYIRRSGDPSGVLGRKVSITADDISALSSILKRIAQSMAESIKIS